MPAPHPAGLRMLSANLNDNASPRSALAPHRDPLFAPAVPPMPRPWGKLIATGLVFAVGLVGFCALVLIVAEASR